jgi:hypothetical protein
MARVTWLFAFLTAFMAVDARSAVLLNRYDHTSTLLPDRSQLICGGTDTAGTSLDSCLRILETGQIVDLSATPMTVARTSHTATLLPTGDVLIAGGVDDSANVLDSAEVYDPETGIFTPTALVMETPRYNHTATLLKTGHVLICGGQDTLNGNSTADCDRYRTSTNDFSLATDDMQAARARHTAVLLRDGRVWVAGGYDLANAIPTLVTSELYVPSLNFFGAGHSLIVARADHTATMMGDGRVFLAGGHNGRNLLENQGYLDTTEIYDPIADSVIPGAKMLVRRHAHTATLMPTGNVVVYGGLGNVTTSYLESFSETIVAVNAVDNSSVTATAYNPASFPIVNLSSGALRLNTQFKLGVTASGVIQNGDIFMSTPMITFAGGIIYLVPGISTKPAEGMRINLDGSEVGCYTTADCGNIDRDFLPADFANLATAGFDGRLYATPVSATMNTFSVSGTHELHFSGGALTQANPNVVLTSGTIRGTIRLRGLPLTYSGFAILGGTYTLTNLNFTQTSSFTVSADSGYFYIPTGTRIVNDPGFPGTAMTNLFTTSIQMTGGDLTWSGQNSAQTFATPVTVPQNDDGGPVTPIVSAAGILVFAPSGANLNNATFTSPWSTIVVRTMHFSDVETYTPSANTWAFSLQAGLNTPIQAFRHTATLMPTGTARFIGGRQCAPGSRDVDCDSLSAVSLLLNYSESPSAWLTSGPLQSGVRGNHTATLLPDGQILIAGGSNGPNVLATAERFNPATETFTRVGDMYHARDLHTASLLTNGRVLVAGGFSTSALSTGATNTSEIYYPETRRWLEAGTMVSSRSNHTAVVLPDGNVMLIGGFANGVYLNTTEVYYSTSGKWLPSASMPVARAQHSATLLKDGRIMVVGGLNAGGILGSTLFFNATGDGSGASDGIWTAGPALAGGQHSHSHTATLLPDGRLMVAGGNDEFGETSTSQIFTNEVAGTWSSYGNLVVPRLSHAAHLLPNGDLLISGGAQSPGNAVTQSERFDVATSSWSLDSNYIVPRAYGTAVMAADNTIYSIGGYNGVNFINSTEKRFYTLAHDQNTSFAPPSSREPLVLSSDLSVVGRGQKITATGLNFLGNTEASGGGTSGSQHFHPRISLQRVADGSGGAAQGGSAFEIDLTTSIYANPDNLWTLIDTSITVQVPTNAGNLPYGWYHLRIGANSQYSDSRLIQAGPNKPEFPVTALSATTIGISSLTWRWTAPSGSFDGYNLYSATTGVLITTRPVATDNSCIPYPCYTQLDLTPNASAQILVAPFSLTGDGPLLESATRFTFATPVYLTLSSTTANSVYLTWSTSTNRPGTIYEISQSTDNFITVSTPVPLSAGLQSLFYTISPLVENTIYSFRIRSFNSDSIPSDFSNVVSTRTRSPVNGLSGLAANTYTINWSWIDPTGVTNFRVYNATTGVLLATPVSNAYVDTNLSTNSARSIMVSAVTGAGEGPLSPSVTVYTAAAVPLPESPSVASLSTGSFIVNYQRNENPNYTRFVVGITSAGPTGISTTTTQTLSAGFPNLDFPGEIWTISVFALNEENIASPTLVVGSTATFARTPSGLTVTGTTLDSISVTWSNSNNTSSVTYQVTYTTDNFVNHVATAIAYSQGFTGNTALISGLQTSTTYSIRVIAKNAEPFNQETVFSNYVTTITSNGGAALGSLAAQVPYQQNVVVSGTLGTTPPRFIKLDIPANTFPSDVRIEISSHDLQSSGLCVAPNVSTTNVAIRLTVDPPLQPVGKMFLTMEYASTEIGSLAVNRLALLRHEPEASKCVPLMSTVNDSLRRVTAPLNHLSIFQLATLNPSTSVGGMRMFPNPWYANRNAYVTFHQVPADSHIKIFTLRGELVHDFKANNSGIVSWDGNNRGGRKVASGVYFVAVESGGDRRIMKLVVLK